VIDRPPLALRVLHVEDEPANRALVRAILARAGPALASEIVLREATSIAEARSFLATEAADVVLVDVRLPDGNGLDLVAEIRARAPQIRVVVVSASVLPADRASALETGAGAFLAKPFGAADLEQAILRLTWVTVTDTD
jgi:CheY-like chemotaxis protein